MSGVAGSWAPVPSNFAFSTLKGRIARYVNLPDSPEALREAGEAANGAISYLNGWPWQWSLRTQLVTLSADVATYGLDRQFRSATSALLLNSSDKPQQALVWQEPKILDWIEPDRTSSTDPRYYTVRNAHDDGLVTLIPPPSSGFVARFPKLQINFHSRLLTLVDDSESLDAPHEVQEFVVWYGRAEMAAIHAPMKFAPAERMWTSILGNLRRIWRTDAGLRDLTW